jgi:hypothetical protein
MKIKLSLGDKLRLLFFGIIEESKLPEVVKYVEKETKVFSQKPEQPSFIELPDEINTREPEEKLDIPFFDLGDDDVKSNF